MDLPSLADRWDLPELQPREQRALRTLTAGPGPRDLLLFRGIDFPRHMCTPWDGEQIKRRRCSAPPDSSRLPLTTSRTGCGSRDGFPWPQILPCWRVSGSSMCGSFGPWSAPVF